MAMKLHGTPQSQAVDMIYVQTKDFDPGLELEQFRLNSKGQVGAIVSFTGLVRDFNDDRSVLNMSLEHYPGMTEKALEKIELEARNKWELTDTIIIHRVGSLKPNDRIVFVAASSAHRKNAFRACEFMIDILKTNAPFWKKEETTAGNHWVKQCSETNDNN